jgi:hypothetical protein
VGNHPYSVPASYVIFAAIVFSLVLVQINQRAASPVLSIVDRWCRWLVFAFGAAVMCRRFEFIDRPFWVLAVSFFLLWFLGETLYNWLRISAISVSPLPLFPRYVLNQSGEEWPVQPRLLKIRGWLRGQGFHQVQALKAEVGAGMYLRVSVYEDEPGVTRVQITFLPQANGAIVVCYALTTIVADGRRVVTDNSYIPFAGFYPEEWLVERRPWARSLRRLRVRHAARVTELGSSPVPFRAEPMAELNATQFELDRLNTKLGFLNPHHEREDLGKITQEGRYRVWKEIWMLNYLGRSARYR